MDLQSHHAITDLGEWGFTYSTAISIAMLLQTIGLTVAKLQTRKNSSSELTCRLWVIAKSLSTDIKNNQAFALIPPPHLFNDCLRTARSMFSKTAMGMLLPDCCRQVIRLCLGEILVGFGSRLG